LNKQKFYVRLKTEIEQSRKNDYKARKHRRNRSMEQYKQEFIEFMPA